MLPLPIEPEDSELSVILEQLSDLLFHIIHIPTKFRSFGRTAFPCAARKIIRMMPVHDRVIEAHLETLSSTLLSKLLEDIALKGGGVDNVIICIFRIEEAESIMMFARDHDVSHASLFSITHPFRGIESGRIELGGKFFVLLHRDLCCRQDPLGMVRLPFPFACGNRIQAPVDEQSEPGLSPPCHPCVLLIPCLTRCTALPEILAALFFWLLTRKHPKDKQ